MSLRRLAGWQRHERRRVDRRDVGQAGRLMTYLYLGSAAATVTSPLLPMPAGMNLSLIVLAGVGAVVAGIVALLLPWQRWPLWTTLVINIPVALTLITVHNIGGGSDPFRYSLFFLVLFVWVGMTHPPGTATVLSPFAAGAYLIPLLQRGAAASDLASALYAVPMFVLVGEVLSSRTERLRTSERRLRTLAYRDKLTGLPNRAAAHGLLDDVYASGTGLDRRWLLFLDLDGFKAVNDALGHAEGDELLQRVATGLTTAAPAGSFVSRWAGDEFLLVLENVDEATARAVAAELRHAVRRSWGVAGMGISASIGIAQAASASGGDSLVALADKAMYDDKRASLSARGAADGGYVETAGR